MTHACSEVARRFLAAVADESRPAIREHVVIVVAHPDDEALACGALLPRLSDCTIVHVTDGAPQNGADAARHGFATPADYAGLRGDELRAALDLAGVPVDRRVCLGVPDQTAALDLAGLTRRIAPLVAGAGIVLTHAHEGGHPDHDATAFAVAAALERLDGLPPVLVEMPFYRADPEGPGWLRQSFAPDGPPPTVMRLNAAERVLKARMLAAHRSQADTLAEFGVADEAFRVAPVHRFDHPPQGGRALYDRYGWGMTSARFCDMAGAAWRELGL